MQQYQSLWEQILAEMHDHLDDEIYNEYFAPLSNVQKLNDSYLYVVAPSPYIQARINRLYLNKINSLAKNIYQQELIGLSLS